MGCGCQVKKTILNVNYVYINFLSSRDNHIGLNALTKYNGLIKDTFRTMHSRWAHKLLENEGRSKRVNPNIVMLFYDLKQAENKGREIDISFQGL